MVRMNPELSVYANRKKMSAGVVVRLEQAISARLRRKKKLFIALAGGTTPAPIYTALSSRDLPWSRIAVTLTDERWRHARQRGSNERMVRSTLLRRRAARARFVSLKSPHTTPAGALGQIEQRLSSVTPLDICVLGMGADGHIASLFPGAVGLETAMKSSRRRAAAIFAYQADGSPNRITLTFGEICRSKEIFLILTGDDKLRVLKNSMADTNVSSALSLLLARRTSPVHAFWAP
ncbi:MAG: 6-phosphogluconolactonase [Alphaproteobacteria bacterium]|nr:6-phosphogluconolactonase [Alphaproteobacteria bacterium]